VLTYPFLLISDFISVKSNYLLCNNIKYTINYCYKDIFLFRSFLVITNRKLLSLEQNYKDFFTKLK